MSARAFRLRVAAAGASSMGTPDHTFYLGDPSQTSTLGEIPDIQGAQYDPLKGQIASLSNRFTIISETVTADLGDSDGNRDWIGRIVDFAASDDGGQSYSVLWSGRITDGPSEMDGPGKYTVETSDERWLERRQSLFATGGGTTMLFPVGLTTAWLDFPATTPITWEVVGGTTDIVDLIPRSQGGVPGVNTRVPQTTADFIVGDVVSNPVASRSDGEGNFTHVVFRSTSPAADRPCVAIGGGRSNLSQLTETLEADPPTIKQVSVYWESHGFSERDRLTGYLYAPTAPPSEANPRHIGGKAGIDVGTFVKNVMDGDYDGDAVRYDADTFSAWNASTNPEGLVDNPRLGVRVHVRATKTWDRAEFLRERVYKPLLIAPFASQAGGVAPRLWRNPQNVSPSGLTTLTASNARVLSVDPRGRDAVTVVQFQAERYRKVGVQYDDVGGDGLLASEPGIPEYTADSVSRVGRKVWEPDITLFPRGGTGIQGDIAREVFDRRQDGPTLYAVETSETTIAEGDFVVLDFDSLKHGNPAVNNRSGDRIVQVAGRRIANAGTHLVLDCEDLGASANALSAPTVTVTADGANAVDVAVSNLPSGAGYKLQIDDGDGWRWVAAGTEAETVTIGRLPANTTVSARAVSTVAGRIRSDFSATDSDTTDALSAPSGLSDSVSGAEATLTWTVGETDYEVEVLVDSERVALLPPGSTRYVARGLAADTYTWGVRHVDRYGGLSTTTDDSDGFTIADASSAPDMRGVNASVALRPRATVFGQVLWPTVAIYLFAGDEGFAIEVERAPDDNGSADEGEAEAIGVFPGTTRRVYDPQPYDGATRWYRARHVLEGYTDGDWTDWDSVELDDIPAGDPKDETGGGTGGGTGDGNDVPLRGGALEPGVEDSGGRPVTDTGERVENTIESGGGKLKSAVVDNDDRLLTDTSERAHNTIEEGGGKLKSAVVDSRGEAVNTMFAKESDTLDDVDDGSNFARISASDVSSNRLVKVPTNFEFEGDGFVPGTHRLKFGTSASPTSLIKSLRIPWTQAVPSITSTTWSYGGGYLSPGTAPATQTYHAAIILPKGVTITDFSARLWRDGGSALALAALWRGSSTTGLATKLAELSALNTGDWQTLSEELSPSQEVGDETYNIVIQLTGDPNAIDARFLWAEITYTTPDYATGI